MSNTEENSTEITVTKKKRKWPVVLGLCIAGAAAAIAIPVAMRFAKTVKLSDYVNVAYDGINGYAAPVAGIDREGLYSALAGDEQNASRLEAYKNFADSVVVEITGDKVANGDTLEVNVRYNEDLRKSTGYRVSGENYSFTAEGIEDGTAVNLFEDAAIDITGISPYAALTVTNKSEDDYLKTLAFSADKEMVKNGDSVKISCDTTDDELADHGFTTSSLTAMYEVKGLSEYIGQSHITKEITDELDAKGKAVIESETVDTTYRMLFKLTQNAEYLTIPNSESVSDINLNDIYFLKAKEFDPASGAPENVLVYIYSGVVSSGDKKETGYFAFAYPDSYVTADGLVQIASDNAKDVMTVSADAAGLTESVVESKGGEYEIVKIDRSQTGGS